MPGLLLCLLHYLSHVEYGKGHRKRSLGARISAFEVYCWAPNCWSGPPNLISLSKFLSPRILVFPYYLFHVLSNRLLAAQGFLPGCWFSVQGPSWSYLLEFPPRSRSLCLLLFSVDFLWRHHQKRLLFYPVSSNNLENLSLFLVISIQEFYWGKWCSYPVSKYICSHPFFFLREKHVIVFKGMISHSLEE